MRIYYPSVRKMTKRTFRQAYHIVCATLHSRKSRTSYPASAARYDARFDLFSVRRIIARGKREYICRTRRENRAHGARGAAHAGVKLLRQISRQSPRASEHNLTSREVERTYRGRALFRQIKFLPLAGKNFAEGRRSISRIGKRREGCATLSANAQTIWGNRITVSQIAFVRDIEGMNLTRVETSTRLCVEFFHFHSHDAVDRLSSLVRSLIARKSHAGQRASVRESRTPNWIVRSMRGSSGQIRLNKVN